MSAGVRIVNPLQEALRQTQGLRDGHTKSFCWSCLTDKPTKGGRRRGAGKSGPHRFTCADCREKQGKPA